METILKTFGEFGVLALMLGFMLVSGFLSVRWVATHAIVPLVQAGVGYLNAQTSASQKMIEGQEKLTELESRIHAAIIDMEESHADTDSVFSTVHTNVAITILAKAVGRVARACDADVDEFVTEIERVLRRQELG